MEDQDKPAILHSKRTARERAENQTRDPEDRLVWALLDLADAVRELTRPEAPAPAPAPAEPAKKRGGVVPVEEEPPLCALLADQIQKNDPSGKRPRVTASWVAAEDRMLRLDKRDPEQARALIIWCQQDQFWRGNILSMPKFREKYQQLFMAAGRDQQTQKSPAQIRAEEIQRDRAARDLEKLRQQGAEGAGQ